MAYRHVTTGISSNLTYRHRKARTLVLNPYLEVVGRTRIMEISLEPAPSASNKLYRYHYTVSCEFPTFPDTIDNQLLPLFLPIRSYRHPALREPALAYTVYGASTILDAKIRIIFEIIHNMVHFYTLFNRIFWRITGKWLPLQRLTNHVLKEKRERYPLSLLAFYRQEFPPCIPLELLAGHFFCMVSCGHKM